MPLLNFSGYSVNAYWRIHSNILQIKTLSCHNRLANSCANMIAEHLDIKALKLCVCVALIHIGVTNGLSYMALCVHIRQSIQSHVAPGEMFLMTVL